MEIKNQTKSPQEIYNEFQHCLHPLANQIEKNFKKNGAHEKIFYQCFCARTYQSYSALYLHAKLKHKENLSFKSLKEKHVEWSGSTKNVYYEFSEKKLGEGLLSPRNSRVLRSQTKLNILTHTNTENQIPISFLTNRKTSSINVPKSKQSISEVFTNYEKINEGKGNALERHELLHKMMEYINEHYEEVEGKVRVFTRYCDERNCEFIPFFFNSFFESISQEKMEKQMVISELMNLSNWLFEEKYSPHLVIEEEKYTSFDEPKQQTEEKKYEFAPKLEAK